MKIIYEYHGWTTKIGLFLGLLGTIGLAVSLLSLLPLNAYNIVVAASGLKSLAKHGYSTPLCPLFLGGSILSSLLTFFLVLAMCCGYNNKQSPSSVYISRRGSFILAIQIGWAFFGTCLAANGSVPGPARSLVLTSLAILWLNHGDNIKHHKGSCRHNVPKENLSCLNKPDYVLT